MYTLYRSPAAFYKCLITVVIALHCTTAILQKFLYYPMLTYSGGTYRSDELCYDCSISIDLTEMVNVPTWIPDFDSHSPALLEIFFFLTLVFLKLGSGVFRGNASNLLNKDKSAIPPLFNGQEGLSSASDKAKLFAENISKNSDLDDSGISLHVFSTRTNLKLRNISVTPKMVKKGHNES